MKHLRDIFAERIALGRAEGMAAAGLFEREFGLAVPQGAFPATITGLAHPQPGQRLREFANQPLKDPLPSCTDPARLEDCFDPTAIGTPDARGFFADEFLPCGVAPVRYRWHSPQLSVHSEGCGFRLKDGNMIPWRQAFYAVNVAHGSADGSIMIQDHDLDYGPVPNAVNPNSYPFLPSFRGLPVIMAWGFIGNLTNDTPKYGFFFTHMTDAIGMGVCRISVANPAHWCCFYKSDPLGPLECTIVPGPSQTEARVQCQSYGLFGSISGPNCTCPS